MLCAMCYSVYVEGVEGELCLLEVLEVPEVIFCVLHAALFDRGVAVDTLYAAPCTRSCGVDSVCCRCRRC